VVVLDHFLADPEVGEVALAVGLDEETAIVAEQLRLDEADTVEPRFEWFKGHAQRPEQDSNLRPTP
jgi:hypothetical protein